MPPSTLMSSQVLRPVDRLGPLAGTAAAARPRWRRSRSDEDAGLARGEEGLVSPSFILRRR